MLYRKDIQILRGIAVLMVVLFHLGLGGFNSGFLGVDVFFVVSGYLMAILYDPNKKLEFFKKRALRLLPAYYVVIGATVLASILIVTPNEYNQVYVQTIYADFFAPNIGDWMQNSYFSKIEFNPLLHLWSLGVEIQFYLIIPVLVYLFSKNVLYLWLLASFSLVACLVLVEISPKTSFFMMPMRLWEFLIGYVVAYYFSVNGAIKVTAGKRLVGSVFLLFICAIPLFEVDGKSLSMFTGHPGLYALLISFSTGAVLAFGVARNVEESIVGSILETLGKYSYSIYLVHFPFIVLYLYKPFSGIDLQIDRLQDLVVLIISIAALSFLSYHFVEKRLRQSNKIFFVLTAMPVAIMLAVGLGHNIQSQIYSDEEIKISNAFQDRPMWRCGKIFRVLNPDGITCELTQRNPGKGNSIMLVGDSHADSIKTVFADIARTMGLRLYFLVPNNPLHQGSSVTVTTLINEAKVKNVSHIVLHYRTNAIPVSTIGALAERAGEHDIRPLHKH